MTTIQTIIFYTLLIFIFFACNSTTQKPMHEMKSYDGPVAIFNNINSLFSDSAKVKVRLTAPLQQEYLNGDRMFPKGIKVYFLEKDGTAKSSLEGNYAKYTKAKDEWEVRGNVLIKNIVENKKLNTEELYWNPGNKKIYTQKFVRIETPDEILTGNGLDANQDFKYYKIRNPTGVFSVKNY
ncbi:MAG: LPS export ABC transporter periplasmic protein LptC [Cytophagales bacterium]|nr:LPS export ABC transporter periplasmic protein LptC [Cytophagales bacterium]